MTVDNWLQAASIVAVALVGLIGIVTNRKLNTISVSVDGRLSELLRLTAKSSRAEGIEQQKKTEAERLQE